MKNKNGFVLLISVIFMSVMLTLGLALSSLGYKQQILASTAIESQYAFYAADAGIECALYADQQQNLFEYDLHSSTNPPQMITCDEMLATQLSYSYDNDRLVVSERISLDSSTSRPRCADVTIYKYNSNPSLTYIFSQGYDVSCATVTNPNGARFVSRGMSSHY